MLSAEWIDLSCKKWQFISRIRFREHDFIRVIYIAIENGAEGI